MSIEDKASLYWMENKGFIIGCVVVPVHFAGRNQWRENVRESAKAKLQAEYAYALANDTLDEFARSNSGNKLGRFAA